MTMDFAKAFLAGAEFGVGKTASGGSMGLAALDGLVAGIEVSVGWALILLRRL